ncbi:alcohol dehydrogenase catalytic domain-containing protein [Homoserinibacter sp. GY 40078]|uniref:zinc-binding dehydrogenase n=1 Tax=Homoserinibacter sp. GY 40078 TaxID=2603275 RepID=UPI0011CAB2AF|nr:alcohol dehydrogenase catalytic domain-containing protein [Homoserinibacter sp. GY 40078]TXK18675.1 zinc-binding dehydrogenase [Homoserinibacter sp. GY 40078]
MTAASAMVIREWGGPEVLRMEAVEIPDPAPGQVLLKVLAASVNHLELEIRAGVSRMPISLPHVPGREVVAEIAAVGDPESPWEPGSRVVLLPHVPCGACANCLSGAANICLNGWMPGIHAWGGHAEYMLAPERGLLAAPDLPVELVAALPISFGTAWRALHATAQVRSGEWVAVAGASGGLGHACLQVAALAGARPIALVRDPNKADFVRACGAVEVLVTSETDWPERLVALTDGGVDVFIDHVGGSSLEGGVAALADRGRLVVAGGHGGEFPALDVVQVFRRELRLLGVRSQRPDDVRAVLDLAVAGRLTPNIAEVLPLRELARAHELIESRSVTGKVVVRP